jgi:hypothetical protein
VAQFIRDFSTCDAPRPGRPKTVTTPEIIQSVPGGMYQTSGGYSLC